MAQTRPAPSASGSTSSSSASSSYPSGSAAQSSSSQAGASQSSATAMEEKKYSGTITNVDSGVSTLTIKTLEGQEMKFAVDASTKINAVGASGKLAGLRAGQQVTVSAKDDKATSIEESAASAR
jgi:hypothetical protein